MTRGARLRRDHLTYVVEIEGVSVFQVSSHHVDSVAVFGEVHVTSGALSLAWQSGASVSFLSENGRLLARLDVPGGPGVLARREQYRRADSTHAAAHLAARFVAGKLQNARGLMLRAAREIDNLDPDSVPLRAAADTLAGGITRLATAAGMDEIRGIEGAAARAYFAALTHAVKPAYRAEFTMNGRTRRPPLDRFNCLLGFLYAMLTNDCSSAIAAAGLDLSVGCLHVMRPGRPALALDLVEEFRPLIADRLALALINRRQISPDDFIVRETGSVEMTDAARRRVVGAWHNRRREELTHPLLGIATHYALLPFIQARLLARHFRGDADEYHPCVMKL